MLLLALIEICPESSVVIQGTADIRKALSEDELQQTMDFCKHVFAPTDTALAPESIAGMGASLVGRAAPPLSEKDIEKSIPEENEDARHLVKQFQAFRIIGPDLQATIPLEVEVTAGFTVCCVTGKLGLVKAL